VRVLFEDPQPHRRPTTAILIRARSVVQVHPGPPFKSPINTRLFSLFQFRGILPAKPFVNDLSTSGIAICRPRRHRRHHDLARGFTDCLNFLLTATALKERKEHKRPFPAYWIVEVLPPQPASTDSRGNRHRHLRYLDHSPPYQGRVACGQSSVLVFEWEWCPIDNDLELA
jgi:hypothetical protein